MITGVGTPNAANLGERMECIRVGVSRTAFRKQHRLSALEIEARSARSDSPGITQVPSFVQSLPTHVPF